MNHYINPIDLPRDAWVRGSSGSAVLICPICTAERFRNPAIVKIRPNRRAMWETCWDHPHEEMVLAHPEDYRFGGLAWIHDHLGEAAQLVAEYLEALGESSNTAD